MCSEDLPIWEFMLLCYRTACFSTIACDFAKWHEKKKTLSLVYFKSNMCLRVHIKFHPLKIYFTKTFTVTWCYLTYEWQLLYYFTLQMFLKNTHIFFNWFLAMPHTQFFLLLKSPCHKYTLINGYLIRQAGGHALIFQGAASCLFNIGTLMCFNRRRQWHPTPVLLPGKSHGWRSLVGCSPWGRWGSDMTEQLHFHFSLSCIGDGNGNPLQCSCLENPRDGGSLVGCRLWGCTELDMTEAT